ncbi:glycosyltransferase family 4 protein [Runella limosa]|uniref:glycosyltransferase family 4 protein n=1 Tax=Runella limosa TaxID=370978 RepID=UPI0003F6F117|nr:glycosyltransferase family 1 protein [Runella limosa]
MKIFIDAHVFDNEYQGTRTYIKEIYNILVKRNDIEFYFAAFDIENLRANFPLESNVYFIKYKSKSKFYRLGIEIPILLKKYKIDYAHFQYVSPLIKNCKTIITIHDILFLDFPKEFSLFYKLSKKILFYISSVRADILTTVSEYSKQRIEHHFKISSKNIFVVPNGVNELYFKEYDKFISQKYIYEKYGIKNYILYVSRIEPRKNHASLLKVLPDICEIDKSISIVFVGHKSINSKDFEDTLDSLPDNLKGCTKLLNHIPNNDLIILYQAARLFFYPSKAEGFGIPPLEAGAIKIPTYCSNTTAMGDFRFFKNTFFNPNDQKEITDILIKALNSTPDKDKLNDISLEIKENYSWDSAANSLISLIPLKG